MPMPRFAIKIEYDGTTFCGWQRQPAAISVQGALETALSAFTSENPSVHGAGRTDAGVHAMGQVAHFDLTKDWDPFRISAAANFHLKPLPISILACARVSDDFHARFSAIMRRYRYRILTRRAPPVLDRDRVWWVPVPLDAARMREAAQVFVGNHDFTTFRAAQCQAKSPVKTLDAFTVEQSGDEIVCNVSARSFLHNQVRSMAGSLKLVGDGSWSRDDLARALAAANRAACGPVAPAPGLYLEHVSYVGRNGWI